MALPLLQFVFWFIGYLLSLLIFLFCRGVALFIVALIHLLKLPSQVSTGVIDSAGELFRSLFESALGIAKDVAVKAASVLFEALCNTAAGSVQMTSEAIMELLEKMRSGLGELSEVLPQVVESAGNMVVQVVDGVWSCYKDAVEYIMENI